MYLGKRFPVNRRMFCTINLTSGVNRLPGCITEKPVMIDFGLFTLYRVGRLDTKSNVIFTE
jgi:hypothetical protein